MNSAPKSTCTLLFGGTFDPPHRAHVELPQAAARELHCDRILYVPAAINPLKATPDQPPPTAAAHRLAMLRLALRDVPNAEISTIELDRAGKSYTIDTLRALEARHRGNEALGHDQSSLPASTPSSPSPLYLLIGADQALEFHRWKDWHEIHSLATPAVMLRPPWTRESFEAALRERYDAAEAELWMSRTLRGLPMIEVSATEIRRCVREGGACADQIDLNVMAYIREHGLYAAD